MLLRFLFAEDKFHIAPCAIFHGATRHFMCAAHFIENGTFSLCLAPKCKVKIKREMSPLM